MYDKLLKKYTQCDIDAIHQANATKTICQSVSEDVTLTDIYKKFHTYLRCRLTLATGYTNTSLYREPFCVIHYRFQKYICLNCLEILCEQCFENSSYQHKVYETKSLMSRARSTRTETKDEIKQIVETLRKTIRAMKMRMRKTKWMSNHRLSMLLKRLSQYSAEDFRALWMEEEERLLDTKTIQEGHLVELLGCEEYFIKISNVEYNFWSHLELIKFPEMEDFFKQLMSRHEKLCPPPRNQLLKDLIIRGTTRNRVHKTFRGRNADENLNQPWGICCNQEGFIFVADRKNHQIKVFKRDGVMINKFGSRGNGPLQFQNPAGIAIHAYGDLVVVDKGNNRVQMITTDGKFVRSFGNNLDHPMDVACSGLGDMVVTNEKDNCLHLYATHGKLITKSYNWPFPTTADRLTKITPRGVCFTPDHNVAITDFKRNSIIIMDYGLQMVLFEIQPQPSELIQKIQSIACDQFCNFVTVDKHNRVHIFNFNGKKRISFGNTGAAESEFQNPTGVCILPDGSICVSESKNNRIHIIS